MQLTQVGPGGQATESARAPDTNLGKGAADAAPAHGFKARYPGAWDSLPAGHHCDYVAGRARASFENRAREITQALIALDHQMPATPGNPVRRAVLVLYSYVCARPALAQDNAPLRAQPSPPSSVFPRGALKIGEAFSV